MAEKAYLINSHVPGFPDKTSISSFFPTKILKALSRKVINSLPKDKIIALSKLKGLNFADHKIDVVKMMISLLDRAENNVGKGENAGTQDFLLFPVFSKAFFLRVVKCQDNLVKS